MRREALAIDAGFAIVVTVVALIISPGVAILGLFSILVLAVCAASYAYDRRSARSRSPRRARPSSRQRG